MSQNPIDEALYNRDGAGQSQRALPLLDPKQVALDPRTIPDLLNFARRFAERVYYYNSDNQIAGTWDQFLAEHPATYARMTAEEKEFRRQTWLEEAAEYYENPEAWEGPEDQLTDFSRPHFSLFMAFLRLTRHIRDQFNALTGDHLDYFYRQALGLTRQQALPDHVNVLVELAEDIDQYLLEKGTQLNAGKDSEGKDLIYETTEDVVLTKAAVGELRTVFVQREYLDAAAYHQRFSSDDDQGFLRLMRVAYGQPEPGDPLPVLRYGGRDYPFTEAQLRHMVDRWPVLNQAAGLPLDALEVLAQIAESELDLEYHALRWQTLINIEALQYDAAAETIVLWGDLTPKTAVQTAVRTALQDTTRANALRETREILGNLNLSSADLSFLIATRDLELATLDEEELPDWSPVYARLNRAWQLRQSTARQTAFWDYYNSDAAGPEASEEEDNPAPTNEAKIRFDNLVAFVLGEPGGPGRYQLPPFDNANITLDRISANLQDPSREVRDQAELYLFEDLRLSILEFNRLIALRDDTQLQLTDRSDLLGLLDRAKQDKAGISAANPFVENWNNIYSFADATQNLSNVEIGVEENDPRWKTFGAPQKDSASDPTHSARIGLAISTPLLELSEGDRRITLFLSFQNGTAVLPAMQELLSEAEKGQPFFRFLFSAGESWIAPRSTVINLGSYLKQGVRNPINVQHIAADRQFKAQGTTSFSSDLNGKYIIDENGNLYRLLFNGRTDRIDYLDAGTAEYQGPILLLEPDEILWDAMRIDLFLDQQAPAITAPAEETEDFAAGGGYPILKILLNDLAATDPETGSVQFRKRYQRLRNLELQRVLVEVEAEGLENYLVQNDYEPLDPAKPFEPFGDEPLLGNGFYITHPEIAAKRLENFRIDLEWLNAPESFLAYYKNYDLVDRDDAQLDGSELLIQNNTDFQVRLRLYDQRELLLDPDPGRPFSLFDPTDATLPVQLGWDNVPARIATERAGYAYMSLDPGAAAEEEEVLEWPRYLHLELTGTDFQHYRYPLLIAAQGFNQDAATQSLRLNEPYTPLLKSMRLAYRAQLDLPLGKVAPGEARIIHLHPFGYAPVADADAYLLPQYLEEGALYIGLQQVNPPDSLQVLFQMAEGSANPDLVKAPITWSFLHANNWEAFGDADIVSDRTNGLLRSGIIKFRIPGGARTGNTLLPADKLWIRATVNADSDSVSDVISIRAQAVEAIFIDQENAEDHLQTPLAAESISATVDSLPELTAVLQPYPSSGGKAPESDLAFYTRISERLRHKQRAITAWDYERLTLERFPDIFKAKCLPNNPYDSEMEPGLVRMVVIPDIIGRFPFNPYQPKVPAEKLVEIREYLAGFMPPFATLNVVNPRYLQINVRVAVKFRTGYNEGFYKAQLEEDLRRFLAPWAYQEGEDIVLGGKIYANVIVNFIEERPYIDFVGRINLFQSSDGKIFVDSALFRTGGPLDADVVQADAPDIVLVSALHHDVEIITEGSFRKELEQGIGHARVELDFYVGANE
ncbi:MAG: baseplate J/gp47 family protein [Bacteroidota bacterium]